MSTEGYLLFAKRVEMSKEETEAEICSSCLEQRASDCGHAVAKEECEHFLKYFARG